MTLISVGSTGTAGGAKETPGSAPGDGAAPSGFDELLAGARPAPSPRRRRRATPPAGPKPTNRATAPATADGSTPAADTKPADDAKPAGTPDDGTTPKPDAPADPFGLIAALAAQVAAVPVTAIPVTDATAAGADTAPAADATAVVVVPDPAVPGAGSADTPPPTVDLTDLLATLPTDETPPQPAPLPLPDLPVNPARTAAADPTALTREVHTPAAAPTPERPHPVPAAAPAPSGAATFAPPAPPPPTSAMANVAIEETAATAGRVAPPPPSEQLVSVLTPLRTTQNGTYTLRLELKPPELGRVEMRVEMRDGVLHASIHAEQHNSAQVLRDALSDLRDRLVSEGVHTGELTVSDGSVGSRQQASGGAPAPNDARPDGTANDPLEPAPAPTVAPTPDADTTSLLDVRV